MVGVSFTVEVAYQFLLRGLIDRALGAGEEIDAIAIASRVGVPVGSVREAVGRLVFLGLARVSADDITELVDFTPVQAAGEARVWAVLHNALVAEVWAVIPEYLPALTVMRERHIVHVRNAQYCL